MWETLDKRKFPRLNIRCDIEIRELKGACQFSTVTENIGAGGVCVILPKELPRSTLVFVKLFVAERESPIECSGKICWRVESKVLFKDEKRFDTGIEFLDILPEDRSFIRGLVDEKMKEKV